MAQPRIGLLAVGFGGLDQAVKLGTSRRTFGRVAGPDGSFGSIVVDRQVAFLDLRRLRSLVALKPWKNSNTSKTS